MKTNFKEFDAAILKLIKEGHTQLSQLDCHASGGESIG